MTAAVLGLVVLASSGSTGQEPTLEQFKAAEIK